MLSVRPLLCLAVSLSSNVEARALLSTGDALVLDVDGAAPASAPVPSGFIGFSGTEDTLFYLLAVDADGSLIPRPSFASLMGLLHPVSGGAGPNLRFGHFWGNPGGRLPPGYPSSEIQVNASTGASMAAALRPWNGSVTATVAPFDKADAVVLADTAAALLQWLGPQYLAGVEAANEPDISSFASNYSGYERTFRVWADGIAAAGLPVPLLDAPVLAGNRWWGNMTAFLAAHAAELRHFCQHRYPLSACNGGKGVSIHHLMDTNSSDFANAFPPDLYAAITGEGGFGLPFVIGEGNTVACNGTAGVSDVLAAALYALDASFSALAANVSRYVWHGLGEPAPLFSYQPIYYNASASMPLYDDAEVRPLFYGLWAVAEAAPAGSAIVVPRVVSTTNPLLRPWASIDQVGMTRVTVLYKDVNATEDAAVTVHSSPACVAGSAATLTRLLSGPLSFSSKTGISYRGLSFDGTTNGVPQPLPGRAVSESVPCSGGSFAFSLPPASAALLAYSSS